jgi:hypothetical protein
MGLDGVREAARKSKEVRFTTLMHHITPQLLSDSFMHLKRTAAPGIDGLTWRQYEEGLAERIEALWGAVQAGRYRALPSRRVYIPKANGKQRPLGIAALEDKIVQQAVVTVLTPIYEADFLGFSYGFRPGRNQHQALDALGGTALEAGELRARRRHPVVLRYHRSRLDDALPRAADCGSTHPASNTQMAHRRSSGSESNHQAAGWNATRGGDLAATG